ncbi:hypothetical protein [Gordonia soli]|uniref:Uncharacterized protein n=1 Tax=Gordonia soli NBRC 108243 TaxID=1223545 RepID=M0QH90_9ACTN|nr:hypothetical protein [Gordonia soli]GAC68000.1 hypothetical protein GS4_11_02710 [Gordonia soli NBRC 108243]
MHQPYPQHHMPAPVIRTHAIADAGMAGRLSRSGKRRVGVVLLIAIGLCSVSVVARALSRGEQAFTLFTIAVGAVSMGLTAFIWFVVIPYGYRRLVPAGSRLRAEFGPAHISVTLGSVRQDIAVSTITGVDADAVALRIRSSDTPGAAGVVIPRELVPPQVEAGLLARFGDHQPARRH